MAVTSFVVAGCTHTGAGALEKLGVELSTRGLKKPLIVTDKGVLRAGLVGKVQEVLKSAGIAYEVFDETVANPTDKNVDACRKLYEKTRCDCLVAVGGGSSIDCAKGCAVVAGGKKSINEFEGFGLLERPMPFFVAIPTTAGTGSETTLFAVITTTKEAQARKMVIGDPRMVPNVGIIDPLLMMSLPPHITAATGMDAMTHAVEGYLSKLAYEYPEAFCKESISIIAEYLPRAVGNGQDLEAREKMAYAQTMAGMGFSNVGVGVVHGMAHPLSAFYNIAHGDANAVLLPYGLEYNKIVRMDKIAVIADLIGLKTCGLSILQAADAAVAGIQELNSLMGIPRTISELAKQRKIKVNKKDIPALAKDAMKDLSMSFNPRVPTLQEIEALYELAWE
ncbi:MAG: iron-containing alcohol dehydrogenase [Betaproteobacteria bacterium]|nr:iron-containing alcohol dehydrogenase [Betaproteobacteria bacterium]